MIKNVQKRVTDIELMPEEPTVCLDNGEQGLECCCDECDYYWICFPEFDLKSKEEIKDIEVPPPSKRHKIRMNRLFRERVGGSYLPFPEEDTVYERVRSHFIIKFKINEFFDRLKNADKPDKNTRNTAKFLVFLFFIRYVRLFLILKNCP